MLNRKLAFLFLYASCRMKPFTSAQAGLPWDCNHTDPELVDPFFGVLRMLNVMMVRRAGLFN